MAELLVIRHAPTLWNAEGRLQGRTDIPLSDAGRETARHWRVPDAWHDGHWRSSPLARARETAALLGHADAALDQRLCEMAYGQFEGRTLAELRAASPDDMAANEARGLDFRPPDGESPREVAERLQAVLVDIAGAHEHSVLIAHKGILRALMVLGCGWTMLGRPPFALNHSIALRARLSSAGAPSDLSTLDLARAEAA
ncbi:MAG: histidine phosphatase family protein [Geminicoccaceae bacterium]